MSTPAPRAVIFDMDGVLLDSYNAHFQSWKQVAADESMEVDEETFARTFGKTSRDVIRDIWNANGDEGDLTDDRLQHIDERKEQAYREIVVSEFPGMPGAVALIDGLHAMGFALAVGTSGPAENVDLVLDQLDRRSAFQATVNGREVTRGKPDPEVFLTAAQKLGIPPHRCAVIEDAPLGVESAKRAGMVAIGLISTGRTADELREAGPHRLVQSLLHINAAEIADLIDAHSRAAEA